MEAKRPGREATNHLYLAPSLSMGSDTFTVTTCLHEGHKNNCKFAFYLRLGSNVGIIL